MMTGYFCLYNFRKKNNEKRKDFYIYQWIYQIEKIEMDMLLLWMLMTDAELQQLLLDLVVVTMAMMIELLSEFEEVQGEVQREEGAFGRATTWRRTIECSSLQLFKCNMQRC